MQIVYSDLVSNLVSLYHKEHTRVVLKKGRFQTDEIKTGISNGFSSRNGMRISDCMRQQDN